MGKKKKRIRKGQLFQVHALGKQKQYNKNGFKMLLQLFVHVVGSLSVGKHCKYSHVTMYSGINILPCA